MVTDPIFGLAADRLETRWGRRRPWLVASVPILMLSLYRLYLPPEEAGYTYFAGWLIVMYVGWTLATVSHTAWALELSRDYDRRSRIAAMLQVAVIFGAIVVSLIPAVMERLGTPSYEEKTAAIGVFLVLSLPLAVLVCLMSIGEPAVKRQPAVSWKGIAILLKSAALFRLMIANALLTFSTYFVQGLFVFFVSYTLGLEDWVGSILLFLIVGGLLCLPLWVKLSEAWSKHKTVQAAVLFGALAPILLLILPPGQVALTAVVFLLIGVNTSANEFLPRSMMADISDEDSVQSGFRSNGPLLCHASVLQQGCFRFGCFHWVFFSRTSFGFDPALGIENESGRTRTASLSDRVSAHGCLRRGDFPDVEIPDYTRTSKGATTAYRGEDRRQCQATSDGCRHKRIAFHSYAASMWAIPSMRSTPRNSPFSESSLVTRVRKEQQPKDEA